jgi:hypothetical protein
LPLNDFSKFFRIAEYSSSGALSLGVRDYVCLAGWHAQRLFAEHVIRVR